MLSLKNRRNLLDLILMYKIVNGLSDLRFNDFFMFKNMPYNLRGNTRKVEVKISFKCSQFRNNFFYRVAKFWNAIPDDIVQSSNVFIFKSKLKKFDFNLLKID